MIRKANQLAEQIALELTLIVKEDTTTFRRVMQKWEILCAGNMHQMMELGMRLVKDAGVNPNVMLDYLGTRR